MRRVRLEKVIQCCGCLAVLCGCVALVPTRAQHASVTVKVEIVRDKAVKQAATGTSSVVDASGVAVWFTPLDRSVRHSVPSQDGKRTPQLVQRNKNFEPHLLVIETGSTVQFPNKDPFFHNVFSLYNGKRFDLGLYEAGSSRSLRFDKPGLSLLFCNIHAEMSAVVIAVETPYYGVSDSTGRVIIPNVPDGRYQMHLWYQRSLPEDLENLGRIVTVSESERTVGPVQVIDNANFTFTHKNMYGQDYVPPPNAGYSRP